MGELTNTILEYDTNKIRDLGWDSGKHIGRSVLAEVGIAVIKEDKRVKEEGKYSQPQLSSHEVVYGLRVAMELSFGELERDVRLMANRYNNAANHGSQIHGVKYWDRDASRKANEGNDDRGSHVRVYSHLVLDEHYKIEKTPARRDVELKVA